MNKTCSIVTLAAISSLTLVGCGENRSPEVVQPDPSPAGVLAPTRPGGPNRRQPVPGKQSGANDASSASQSTAQPAADRVIARVNGQPITLSQIEQPLIEGYGLNILLNVVQLEVAKEQASRAGITVTEEDFNKERDSTIAKLFQDAEKSEYDALFEQFLQQQKISRPEFDLVLRINTYLRKLAEPLVKGKITEEALQEAFRQLYGETVQIRHIQLSNMQEVTEAKARLAQGEPFEKVANEMSRNARTAALGGEIPPFSRQAAGYPQAFKDTAFSLKEGEVSDPVMAEGAYHLIKLEHRIPPKVVKYEDVKESLRQDLLDRLVQATIKNLRAQIGADALKSLTVDDPTLKEQFENRLHHRDQQVKDKNQIREQFERDRQRILERAATQPSTTTAPATRVSEPTTAPTSVPATSPAH